MDMAISTPVNEVIRERDFYRSKLEQAKGRIKTLEFDLSELQKQDTLLRKQLRENQGRPMNGNRPKYRKQS
jgi:TolA-binding protein|tara:strand:+ start:231 stop:443 length:213 start_codon:yes stop_codon:yes gene_type:complete